MNTFEARLNAAITAFDSTVGYGLKSVEVRNGIRAALESSDKVASIRSLSWMEDPVSGNLYGKGITGIYMLTYDKDEKYSVSRPDGTILIDVCVSETEAKRRAQQDYEKIIRSVFWVI